MEELMFNPLLYFWVKLLIQKNTKISNISLFTQKPSAFNSFFVINSYCNLLKDYIFF